MKRTLHLLLALLLLAMALAPLAAAAERVNYLALRVEPTRIAEGETVLIRFSAQNPNEEDINATLSLVVNGVTGVPGCFNVPNPEGICVKTLFIESGEMIPTNFEYEPPEPGEYGITMGGHYPTRVVVTGGELPAPGPGAGVLLAALLVAGLLAAHRGGRGGEPGREP